MSAKEKTIVYQKENKTVSTGGAAASQNNSNIFADKIVAYFSKRGKKEIVRAEAFGNVIIKTAKETAKGEKGVYNLQTGEVVLFGNGKNGLVSVERENNVLRAEKITAYLDKNSSGKIQKAVASGRVEVITPKGFAKGDRGIYNPNTDKVELFDNVRIEQNGNFIEGAYAQTDLATSVSKIMGSSATKGRIYGTFYKTRKTNNGNAAKK